MKPDAHGRLVAPPPSAPGSQEEVLDDEQFLKS